jgi:hypothetical protein
MRTELELYDIIKPYSNANAEGGSDIGTYDAITCLMEVQKQARAEAFKEVLIKFRLDTTAQVIMWLSNSIALMSFKFGKEEKQ